MSTILVSEADMLLFVSVESALETTNSTGTAAGSSSGGMMSGHSPISSKMHEDMSIAAIAIEIIRFMILLVWCYSSIYMSVQLYEPRLMLLLTQ